MAGLKQTAKKLQKALIQRGQIVKIGTTQFYSDEQEKIVTLYILSIPVDYKTKDGSWRKMDYKILQSSAMLEIVKCLIEMWETQKEWN